MRTYVIKYIYAAFVVPLYVHIAYKYFFSEIIKLLLLSRKHILKSGWTYLADDNNYYYAVVLSLKWQFGVQLGDHYRIIHNIIYLFIYLCAHQVDTCVTHDFYILCSSTMILFYVIISLLVCIIICILCFTVDTACEMIIIKINCVRIKNKIYQVPTTHTRQTGQVLTTGYTKSSLSAGKIRRAAGN